MERTSVARRSSARYTYDGKLLLKEAAPTTNAERLANFLRGRKPHRFCDQCIADEVQLGSRAFGQGHDHSRKVTWAK